MAPPHFEMILFFEKMDHRDACLINQSRPMRISLLDPGLKVIAGHHFDLDLRLAKALARGGHEVTIHGHAHPDPALVTMGEKVGMSFRATFHVYPYAKLDNPSGAKTTFRQQISKPFSRTATPEPSLWDAYQALERATAQDLAAVAHADLWLWPTLLPYQLAAAANYAGSVRQLGGVWWLPRFPHEQGAQSWAATARRLAQTSHRIVVGAYDELLCQGYQDFAPRLDVRPLPCPHDGAPNERRPTDLRRIGFFGHQRMARGIDLIPELVAALVAKGYEVVVQDSSGQLTRRMNDTRVTVLEHIDNFAAELARCDLVIWPSRWESYTQSLSGVVSESIATGVPVIMPSGCLPAQMVARHGCGVYFHDYSSAAILAAVAEAEDDFPGLCARARAAATAWHRQNGSDRLATWIEQHIGTMN